MTKKQGNKKGTIIMLHGNSSSSRIYTPIFNSEIQYQLISFDFYGHGNSLSNGKYTVSDFKEQILAIIENINDDILLVGHSLGGHLALEIAMQIKRLKGLLIFGAPPMKKPINFEEAFTPLPELGVFFVEKPLEQDIDKAFLIATHNNEVIPLLKEDFLKCDPKVRSVLAKEFDEYSDELAIISKLTCGKYILKGQQDPTINPEYLEQHKTNAGYELISIKNCGHFPSVEQPKEFISHLDRIAEISFDK